MTRIIVERLKPHLKETLHQTQYCRVKGKTVLEGAAAIRHVIVHAEMTGKSLCVVSTEFSEAFDKISQEYLQKVQHALAFSESFYRRVYAFVRNSDFGDNS